VIGLQAVAGSGLAPGAATSHR